MDKPKELKSEDITRLAEENPESSGPAFVVEKLAQEVVRLREDVQTKWEPLLEASRGAVGSLHRTPAWAWSVHLHELERALKPFEDLNDER